MSSTTQGLRTDDAGGIRLHKMCCEDYASYSEILGYKAINVDGMMWSQVRSCFFRPLMPFREYDPATIRAPRLYCIGGFQHAVPEGAAANSFLNLRMFENAAAYSLDGLDSPRRRQVRTAGKRYAVRPVTNVDEFKTKAYPVYLSFYNRTGYATGAWRKTPDGFARWAEALFRYPAVAILGGFDGDRLAGVCVVAWVEDTLFYATQFCATEALAGFLPDLLLHTARDVAAREPGIHQVYAGMRSDDRGLDRFYELRGCRLVRKPARLRLSPWARIAMRHGAPGLYAKVVGSHER